MIKKNIRKGDKIKENNLIMKRPADNYVNCTNIEDLINKNVYPANKEDLKVEEDKDTSALGPIGLKPKIVH